MATTKKISAFQVIGILLVALMLRVLSAVVLGLYIKSAATIDNGSAIIQYAILCWLSLRLLREFNLSCQLSIKPVLSAQAFMVAIGIALTLLCFTYGESALEVFIVAQSAPLKAYSLWGFHPIPYEVTVSKFNLALIVITQFIVAPIVEELYFRGTLFRALSTKYGGMIAIIIESTIFTSLHFVYEAYLSTFIFSFIITLIYVRYNSIWVNALCHSVFNTVAFYVEFYTSFHWIRTPECLKNIVCWEPELLMLLISTPIIIFYMINSIRILQNRHPRFNNSGVACAAPRTSNIQKL